MNLMKRKTALLLILAMIFTVAFPGGYPAAEGSDRGNLTEQEYALQDSVSKDTISEDTVSPDMILPDTAFGDTATLDSASQDSLSPDTLSQDQVSLTPVTQDTLSQDCVSSDTVLQDSVSPDSVPVDKSPAIYTVTFDANGGSGSMAGVAVPGGEKYILPDCTFTAPVGEAFGKWDLGEPGDEIDITEDTRVRAVWKEGFFIRGLKQSYPYTGYAVTPSFRVYDGDYEMIQGRDYVLKWSNNVDAGMNARVTISFTGNYSGWEKHKTFAITPPDINDADISAVEGVANNKVQKLAPVIYYKGKLLKKNADYTLSYTDTSGEGVPYRTPGKWKITVTGKGSFAGSSTTAEEILHAEEESCIPLSNKKIAVKLSAKSTGVFDEAPVPTVTYMGSKLEAGKDYSLKYPERTGTGNAAILIEGKGAFCGTRAVSYKVTKENLSVLARNGLVRISVNDGAPVTVAKGGAVPSKVIVEARKDEASPWKELEEGKDYRTAVTGNKKAGKDGTVKITGLGNYKGGASSKFPIAKQSLSVLQERLFIGDVDVTASKKDAYKKVKYVLYDLDDNLLKRNTDYTAAFEKLDDKTARITLTGKGNYDSTTVSGEYNIITGKMNINKAKIHYLDNGEEVKLFNFRRAPVILDKSNIRLYNGRNEIPSAQYEIASCLGNLNKGNAVIAVRGINGYSGLMTYKYRIAAKPVEIEPFPGKKAYFIGDSRTVDMFSGGASKYSGMKADGINVYAKDFGGFSFFRSVMEAHGDDDYDILIVWMGTNDSGRFEPYKDQYKKVLDKGKTLILCTVGPTNNESLSKEDSIRCANSNMRRYNEAMTAWAEENNVHVIDLYTYISRNVMTGGDGIHYSPQPTKKIWEYIISELDDYEDLKR